VKKSLVTSIAALVVILPAGASAASAKRYVSPTAASLEAWGKATFNRRFASAGDSRRISRIRCLKESAFDWFCVGHLSGELSTEDWIVSYDPHTGVNTWRLQP